MATTLVTIESNYDTPMVNLVRHVYEKTYFCNYPEDLNVDKIVTSTKRCQIYDLISKFSARFNIPMNGDILKAITLVGVTRDIQVEGEYCGKIFWRENIPVTGCSNIFINFPRGIPIIKTGVKNGTLDTDFKLHISKAECESVEAEYLLLDTEDRKNVAYKRHQIMHDIYGKLSEMEEATEEIYKIEEPKPKRKGWLW